MGLPKKVCSKKPDSDSPPPSSAAIRIRGRRIFQMMLYWAESFAWPSRMRRISPTGMATLPALMFSTVITTSAAASSRNTSW